MPGKIFGCKRCGASSAQAAADNRDQLKLVAELVDRSHFAASILECPCGQRWLSIFTEIIDWSEGNDAQYCTLLPVTKSEADELQEQGTNVSPNLLRQKGFNRRYLQIGNRVVWADGQLPISPHDC